MPDTATIKQLLEAGAHFGHQTGRWNPRMKQYIFTKRNGIHIIDLEKTAVMLDQACDFIRDVITEGKTVLFVGTKKQAQESVEEEAKRCEMYYVNQRWLGGMLTNFSTIQARIDQLVRMEDQHSRGEFGRLTKKEILKISEKIEKMNRQMGGFKEMTTLPGTIFIIDPTKERIAIAEARRMGVPIVAIVDTNCNPDDVDYPIPANDDAIRAIKLICNKIAEAVLEGKSGLDQVQTALAEETDIRSEEGEEVELSEPLIFTPDEE